MQIKLKKLISLVMLAMVLMGQSAFAFNGKWIAHVFDHEYQIASIAGEHSHATPPTDESDSPAQPLSKAEHQLIHVAAQLLATPVSSDVFGLGLMARQPVPPLPTLLAPPGVELDAPFRPPRTTFRI